VPEDGLPPGVSFIQLGHGEKDDQGWADSRYRNIRLPSSAQGQPAIAVHEDVRPSPKRFPKALCPNSPGLTVNGLAMVRRSLRAGLVLHSFEVEWAVRGVSHI
jgi:hypothetical protein